MMLYKSCTFQVLHLFLVSLGAFMNGNEGLVAYFASSLCHVVIMIYICLWLVTYNHTTIEFHTPAV